MSAGETTKLNILEMGLRLWRAGEPVTARRIAKELDLTHGAVSYHFRRGEHSMRDAIAYHAVRQGEAPVIAALIVEKHKAVAHLTEAQRLHFMTIAAR